MEHTTSNEITKLGLTEIELSDIYIRSDSLDFMKVLLGLYFWRISIGYYSNYLYNLLY